jgi:hypothetical protein
VRPDILWRVANAEAAKLRPLHGREHCGDDSMPVTVLLHRSADWHLGIGRSQQGGRESAF